MNYNNMVWIDGALVAHDEVRLSPFNLGVSVGLGVFETLIAYRGVCPTFENHYVRLRSAAGLMQMEVPEQKAMADAVQQVIKVNRLCDDERVRVRISLGAGEHALTAREVSPQVSNTLMISAVSQPSAAAFALLVKVPMRCNEHGALAGVKAASYAENVMAYRYAVKAGGDEALMLNTSGNLCECSMSNLFLVKGGGVFTPSLSSGCLPGVTRAVVLKLCAENGIPAEECDLSEGDLLLADEMFITSSAREVQAANLLGSAIVCPGSVTTRIATLYEQWIRS